MCKNLHCVQIFVYICTIKMKQLTLKFKDMKNINTQPEENLNIMNATPVTFTDRMMLEALYTRYSRNKRAWLQYKISDSDWSRISKQVCSQIDAIEAVCGQQLDLFLKHFN